MESSSFYRGSQLHELIGKISTSTLQEMVDPTMNVHIPKLVQFDYDM